MVYIVRAAAAAVAPRHDSQDLHRLAAIVIGGFMLLNGAVVWQISPARGHDHNRPDLSKWFMSLHSKHGAPCCDGSEAMHLSNVDWTAPDNSDHHYRVKIPVNVDAYQRARHSEEVETMWVDVPDDAVIDDPNKEGTALVWPIYGYHGATVRCFMRERRDDDRVDERGRFSTTPGARAR